DEDINAGQLIAVIGFVTLLIAVLVTAALSITLLRFDRAQAEVTEQTGYPNLQETRMNGLAQLNRYEVVDREAKIYRIPIERAMQLVVEESQ
ncbi:MAG: hypothetical protein HKN17_00275, partial [Rhodothermales bacterium]|nr:hypothetical protein [Rhodothermales bacterium]